MNILVMDAQGGGIGKQVVTAVRTRFPDVTITAVGTNAAATTAMLRAGADEGATGENAAVVCCRRADVIIGPVGIVIADAERGQAHPHPRQPLRELHRGRGRSERGAARRFGGRGA